MSYNIVTPIALGLFTLTTAILIAYFFWLWHVLIKHPRRDFIIFATISMIIMVVGLLLTGIEL